MPNFRKKIILFVLALTTLSVVLYQIFWFNKLNDGLIEKVSLKETLLEPFSTKEHFVGSSVETFANATEKTTSASPTEISTTSYVEKKLVTIFTTIVYDESLENAGYRFVAQSNFLRMTKFESFKKNANIIIFTNSDKFKSVIKEEYPDISVRPCEIRNGFRTAMLKDLFLSAQEISSSFFYMFANADNLYDSGLIRTLEHVKNAWECGLLRQKILIVGLRNNKYVEETVPDETAFETQFRGAVPFRTDAQDYFIVTKDSIEWGVYPEVLVGRRAYDNMMIDFGVHNEIETIDGSTTIRLVHQSERGNDYSTFHPRNNAENEWNLNLAKFQLSHVCITCSRYKSEFVPGGTGEVKLFDKKTNQVVSLNDRSADYFEKEHRYWVEFQKPKTKRNSTLPPSLVIAVLAYNKPDSLTRLLASLEDIGDEEVRIDLIISLDIGYLGYYDLPTLIVAKKYDWPHGEFKIILKKTHRGQVHQWLEVLDCVESKSEIKLLIIEDCMVMCPKWHSYVSGVMAKSEELVGSNVSGWSLDPPLVWQSPGEMVSAFYQEKAANSSLVLADLKRVRSLIPDLKVWKGFVGWFTKESDKLSKPELSETSPAKLEFRGTHTDWQSGLWATWFSYYLNKHHHNRQEIAYITKRTGFLANKIHMSVTSSQIGCFSNEAITSEIVGLAMSVGDDDILIPDVVPKIKIQPVN